MMKIVSVNILFLLTLAGHLYAGEVEIATNTKPVAVLTSTPNQTWFYNLEDVIFQSGSSYDPDGGDYILQSRYFVNGSSIGTYSYTNSAEKCFALHGSPSNGCTVLASGVTTVTVGLQVMDNHGLWSTMVSKTYTIQEHKGRKYFVTDHIGNVRATVNRDGNVLGYDDYYPFGKVMRSNNIANPNDNYKFTGHERDTEAGLSIDYMNARTYDPITSIFMQRDPLEDLFPGWNPYHYVHNNPVNLIDPTGKNAKGKKASENEEEREARDNRPKKVGIEVTGTGWGAVGANLISRGSGIPMQTKPIERKDSDDQELNGNNQEVNNPRKPIAEAGEMEVFGEADMHFGMYLMWELSRSYASEDRAVEHLAYITEAEDGTFSMIIFNPRFLGATWKSAAAEGEIPLQGKNPKTGRYTWMGEDIIGAIHTHPGMTDINGQRWGGTGKPSTGDRQFASRLNIPMYIISNEGVTYINKSGSPSNVGSRQKFFNSPRLIINEILTRN